eukprot:10089342-Heterocapsa_arctica.AAC.1
MRGRFGPFRCLRRHASNPPLVLPPLLRLGLELSGGGGPRTVRFLGHRSTAHLFFLMSGLCSRLGLLALQLWCSGEVQNFTCTAALSL